MRIKILSLALFSLLGLGAWGQSLYLDFTSQSEARYYFYLNGKLLNQKSKGHIHISGLNDEKYHLRIVLDDPFSVAVTKTFRPSAKKCEYALNFNAVRERIYVKRLPPSGAPDIPEGRRIDSHAKPPAANDNWDPSL